MDGRRRDWRRKMNDYDWTGNEWRRRRMNAGGDERMTEEMNNSRMTHPLWMFRWTDLRMFQWMDLRIVQWTDLWMVLWMTSPEMNIGGAYEFSFRLSFRLSLLFIIFICIFVLIFMLIFVLISTHFCAHFRIDIRFWGSIRIFVLLAFFTSLLPIWPLLIKCPNSRAYPPNRDSFAAY